MTGVFKFPKYEQHPIALELMPGGMDPFEFTAFCEDIEERGVLMPITLFDGKVLDGWHRYRAAEKAHCAFKTVTYEGKDPAGYVASVNVQRRKLSSLQRALVGCKLHREHGWTQRQAASKLGISNEVITLVLRCMDSGSAKLIKRIETDSDFTRGMLKEELTDAGLLRAKEPAPAPTGPTSVFDAAKVPQISMSGATTGIPDEDEEEDQVEEIIGKGKKSADRAARKPQATAAQLLADGFKALMHNEKVTFLKMIWPEAKGIVTDEVILKKPKRDLTEPTPKLKSGLPPPLTPEKALAAAVKKPAARAAKTKVTK